MNLRDDFRPESDVDVLIEFEAEHRYTYFTLAQIEDELTYPGQIRVTVVRESRSTEIAH